MRDHKPFVIDEFKGLWARQDYDSCPPDHFTECNNVDFRQGAVATRDGISYFMDINSVKRMYPFNQETGHSLIILDEDGSITDSNYPGQPILTIPTMTDFGFISHLGRAYISPSNGVTGLPGHQVYVYEGDGTPARLAAGLGPINLHGIMSAANSAVAGNVEAGTHIFAIVYETDSGFLTNYGPDTLPVVVAPGNLSVDLANMSSSPDLAAIKKIRIVATKSIAVYNGDPLAHEFFFIPGAVYPNGQKTARVSFFDSELLESADDLQDQFTAIPAGVGLGLYHNRMLVYATAADISACWVSKPGEPEAINEIDGLIVFPLDGDPITNAQEFRDVLYMFKQSKTNAWSDNGDVPSSWPITILDQGIGCSLHGLATVLDSGGVNVDYMIICDLGGIYLFNGTYVKPELSWKLRDLWLTQHRPVFNKIRIVNNTVAKRIFILLPNNVGVLLGDYRDELTPKDIYWSHWTYNVIITDLAFLHIGGADPEFDTLMLGASGTAGGVYRRTAGKRTDSHRDSFLPTVITEGKIPDPMVAHFEFGQESEYIQHIGAIALGIVGSGNLIGEFVNINDELIYPFVCIMRAPQSRIPRLLINAQGQRLRVRYRTVNMGEVFILDKITLWYKDLWTEHPGDAVDVPEINPLTGLPREVNFKWPHPNPKFQ